MNTIEINLEDGTSVRWATDKKEKMDEALESLAFILGPPDTIKT